MLLTESPTTQPSVIGVVRSQNFEPTLAPETIQNSRHYEAFVGNLPNDVTETIVKELFSRCGDISALRVSPGKGYAIITFTSQAGVEKAIELNGTVFKFKLLKVSYNNKDDVREQPIPKTQVQRRHVSCRRRI